MEEDSLRSEEVEKDQEEKERRKGATVKKDGERRMNEQPTEGRNGEVWEKERVVGE